ncbi:MAG: sulfur carrier protein [Actinomycetota bacterium]|nr:sulfur carrier protein [Actinomycetota bacterium]
MNVTVNGRPHVLPEDSTIATAVEAVLPGAAGAGIAVAIDGQVVPANSWTEHALHDGDALEVIMALQGG